MSEALRPTPWKIPDDRLALSKTVAGACPLTPYSLALQEHIRRQQNCCNRISENMTKVAFSTASTPQGVLISPRQLEIENRTILNMTVSSPVGKKQVSEPTSPNLLTQYSDQLAASQYGFGRKIFPCSQCRYTTDRRNNLKRHMLTMHQACSKLLECCGILFTTKASLREHAMIFHYHGYTCFYCGRRFCRKALLKRHLSVHNGQKDFVCPICDYATSHKSNLERHRKVHVRQEDGKEGSSSPGKYEDDGDDVNVSENMDCHDDDSSDDLSVCSDDNIEINVQTD